MQTTRTNKLSRYNSRLNELGKMIETERIKAKDRRFQQRAERRYNRMDATASVYSNGVEVMRGELL